LLIAVLTLAACGGSDESGVAGARALSLELREQNGSGQSGTATLEPAGEGSTTVVVELSTPPREPQPSHVHSGTCDKIGPVVAPLESVVDGHAESTVPLSLEELQRGDLLVHAHLSEAQPDVSVACAPIPTS